MEAPQLKTPKAENDAFVDAYMTDDMKVFIQDHPDLKDKAIERDRQARAQMGKDLYLRFNQGSYNVISIRTQMEKKMTVERGEVKRVLSKGKSRTKHYCSECKDYFFDFNSRHKLIHEKDPAVTMICAECGKMMARNGTVSADQHLANSHSIFPNADNTAGSSSTKGADAGARMTGLAAKSFIKKEKLELQAHMDRAGVTTLSELASVTGADMFVLDTTWSSKLPTNGEIDGMMAEAARNYLTALRNVLQKNDWETALAQFGAEDQPPSLDTSLAIREDKPSDTQTAEPETGNDSIFNSPIVTIALGPKKVRYLVHEKVLEQAGQLLNKTVPDGFPETHNKYIELPDDDADVFEFLVKWLYGSCVNPSANKDLLCKSYACKLVQLYILAHKYMIDGLQDDIMSEMYDQMQVYRWEHMDIDEDVLTQLWACTPSSHMHKLLARWFIYDAMNPSMSDMPEAELNSLPERPIPYISTHPSPFFKPQAIMASRLFLRSAAALRPTTTTAASPLLRRSFAVSSCNRIKESSDADNHDYDKHKQDSLSKQKSGKGHWKPELASDGEEAVKADRTGHEDISKLQERTKSHAEEKTKQGTSATDPM
ncbi:hypothetical protein VP1G_05927 [Cytospora mali]|uniref:BTB domain-containing protein n=1 Tax=Cytospora mali TaxID=578113 RepID=A0A194V427_CYTMA|nr:hypothetical protein VP1G_05927 [Valsa mali var. pyri (nom. inval.)]